MGRSNLKSAGRRYRLELHSVAEPLQAPHETPRELVLLAIVKIQFAEVLIWVLIDEQVVNDA